MNLGVKKQQRIKLDKFRILILICFGFLSMPMYLSQISEGLDPSWVYAINSFNEMGFKFGEDILFTYGPLGFLWQTVNIDYNIYIYFIFWGIVFVIHMYLLLQIAFFDSCIRIDTKNLLGSLLLYILAVPLSADYYISMIIFLALSLAWFSSKKARYFSIACILSTAMLFIKFSGAIFAVSGIVIFVLLYAFYNKGSFKQIFKISLMIPVTFTIGYLIYNPSIKGLISYIKSAKEITAGYNIAMSLNMNNSILLLAIIVAIMYCAFLSIILYLDRDKGLYMLIYCGAFFLTFKHGFVRADGHVEIFFTGFLMLISIILLFIDWKFIREKIYCVKTIKNIFLLCMLGIIMLPIFYINKAPKDIINIFTNKAYEITKGVSWKINNPIGEGEKLPVEMLNEIKQESVTIFPWEISYVAHNDINYIPMPVFQAYSAYTPYLDNANATFLNSEETAPNYILFRLDTIDGRYPLIEVPETWDAIYRNYEVQMYKDGLMLLKRVERKVSDESIILDRTQYNINDSISIPESNNLIILEADMELNFMGKLFKTFFRIPEVMIEVCYDSGKIINGRIIPENLKNGIIINNLPYDIQSVENMLNQGNTYEKVKQVTFYGEGLKYYKEEMQIKFLMNTQGKK